MTTQRFETAVLLGGALGWAGAILRMRALAPPIGGAMFMAALAIFLNEAG